MHKRHGMFLVSVVLLGMLLVGCVATPTLLERDYGTSYRLARAQQILTPETERNLAPVEGLDGEAAVKSLVRYLKTFEEKPPPHVFAIPVGAIK